MIIDKYNVFSDAQEETTVATHDSDNVVDLGADGDALARPMRLHVQVPTAVTSSGAATVQFKLMTSSDNGVADSYTTLWDSGAIGKDTLTQGHKVTGPAGVVVPGNCERYLKAQIIVGGAALTAGAFDIFLSPDGDSNKF
jgi:hypothetical protein